MIILTTVLLAIPAYLYWYHEEQKHQNKLLNIIKTLQSELADKNVLFYKYENSIFTSLQSYTAYLTFMITMNTLFEDINGIYKTHDNVGDKLSLVKKDFMNAVYHVKYSITLFDLPTLLNKVYSMLKTKLSVSQDNKFNTNEVSENEDNEADKTRDTNEVSENEDNEADKTRDTNEVSENEDNEADKTRDTNEVSENEENEADKTSDTNEVSENEADEVSENEADENEADEVSDTNETIVGDALNGECELDIDLFGEYNRKYSNKEEIIDMISLNLYNIINTLIIE
jgi:hypothetical protein